MFVYPNVYKPDPL